MPDRPGRPTTADETVRHLISEYLRRAELLRQIHSNKAVNVSVKSRWFTIATIVIATIVTLIGFLGTTRLVDLVPGLAEFPPGLAEVGYSLIVLTILVLTILGLVFRFDERSTRHYNSVEVLTEFIRDYEDRIALSRRELRILTEDDLLVASTRYKGIIARLPANTDKEYVRAKEASHKKAVAKLASGGALDVEPTEWVDDSRSKRLLPADASRLALLLAASSKAPVLSTVRDVLGGDTWVTGGFIREAVWDHLHGFCIPSPCEDLDVVYFNQEDLSKEADERMAEALKAGNPNVQWSVKNQARMHLVTNEDEYVSLEDAVSRFPETATALAVRLDHNDVLHILAPHGAADLFNLVLRPTAEVSAPRLEARAASKRWEKRWPKLSRAGVKDKRRTVGGRPADWLARQFDTSMIIRRLGSLVRFTRRRT